MVTPCDAHLYKGVTARCSIKGPKTHRRVQHDKRTPAAVQTVLFYMVSVLPSHTVFSMKVSQTVCVCERVRAHVCVCMCGNGNGLNFVMHLLNPITV